MNKKVADVTTGDYIDEVKEKAHKVLIQYGTTEATPLVLEESAGLAMPPVVSVRDAKARLSALLEWVSLGHEVTITSDGKPKASLVPVSAAKKRKRFSGMGKFLLGQPIQGGPAADEVIREDRDARGW